MPLVHISLRAGKPEAHRQAIFDGLYRAMHETFNVPEDDQFVAITEHDATNFRYSASYIYWSRSKRRPRLHPDHREQHSDRGAEEGAVPADYGTARREPRHTATGCFREHR